MPGVTLLNIDDFEKMVETSVRERRVEAAKVFGLDLEAAGDTSP